MNEDSGKLLEIAEETASSHWNKLRRQLKFLDLESMGAIQPIFHTAFLHHPLSYLGLNPKLFLSTIHSSPDEF